MAKYRFLIVCIISLILTACVAASPPPPTVTSTPKPGRALVYGDISDDPGEVIEGSHLFVEYLAARLGDYGITEGRVQIASDADQMAEWLASGEVDFYCDSVYPATLISDRVGAQPILRRWRFGVESYHSIIFTCQECEVKTLDDLRGHIIALDNPFSTSGYLLPAVKLIESGLTLTGKASTEDSIAPNEVGFVFSYDDPNTLQWLLSGKVAAGATDDYNYEVAFPEDVRAQLVQLAETESVPRQVVMVRPGMDPALIAALKTIMTSIHETEEGRAVLEPYQTTRFDEFPEGIEAAQQRMRTMMGIVQDIPLP